MTSPHIPGGTSTGSKQPSIFYGPGDLSGLPVTMSKGRGARLWDGAGREFLDFGMGLGAVALGYAHPAVVQAATEAVASGATGSLSPAREDQVAGMLVESIAPIEQVRFLKSGAEALAAAVRIARAATGRDEVVTCGYHGWLDWCQDQPGVPSVISGLSSKLKFNDITGATGSISKLRPAAVVVEPVIDGPPDHSWLLALRDACDQTGSVLVFDEVKTAFRIAFGGAAERYGVKPDLMVIGKALANGFPLSAVGGRADLMEACGKTWISSTLASESVGLAAAWATISVFRNEPVIEHLERVGTRLFEGIDKLASELPDASVRGTPQMCYLALDQSRGASLARGMVNHGIIWKPAAYDFVSFAHSEEDIDLALDAMATVLRSRASQG